MRKFSLHIENDALLMPEWTKARKVETYPDLYRMMRGFCRGLYRHGAGAVVGLGVTGGCLYALTTRFVDVKA